MAVSYRREVYEDRSARISILAGRKPPRPDTLKQTDQPSISATLLQTGRAIRFKRLDDPLVLGGMPRPLR